VLCFGHLYAQDESVVRIPLIGDNAPSFYAKTTNGPLHFSEDYGRNWKIILSHPRDFTPVCTSEILELAQMQNEFSDLNVNLVILSTDLLEKHNQWKAVLEQTVYKEKSPVKIDFPFIDDNNMAISKMYGMIHLQVSTTKDVRGVFIISPTNKIESIYFYPMNVGRNMEEIKRTVMALQAASGMKKDQLFTPANWEPGDDLMVPYLPYTESELNNDPGLADQYYNVGSFMWFKKEQMAEK
jgi:peroxiredoxin (alkyl hydroperoxide reductase subunit C)